MTDSSATGRRRPARSRLAAGALGLALFTAASELSAQPQGPIKLFPDLEQTDPAPARPTVRRPQPQPSAPEMPSPADDREAVRVEGLDAMEIDAVGAADGLDPEIWRGADADTAAALIARLPLPDRNRPLAEATRRLLLTGAVLEGGGPAGEVVTVRVERLLQMGALDVGTLVAMLPVEGTPLPVVRMGMEADLLRGDEEAACRRLDEGGITGDDPFVLKLRILCPMVAGDDAAADLALSLLRDEGQLDDPRFMALAGGGDEDAIDSAEPLSALHVAMLRQAGRTLPEAALEGSPAAVATAVALEPALAPGRALEMADVAFSRGAIDGGSLRSLYGDAEPAGDPLDVVRNAAPGEARAAVLAAAGEGADPAEVARLFDILWSRTEAEERLIVAELLQPALARLPVRDDLAFAAASIARAGLATGQTGTAVRWYELLRRTASNDVSAREAAGALAPLMAIAGAAGGRTSTGVDPSSPEFWAGADPWLLALAEGVGVPVPRAAWRATLDGGGEVPGAVPAGYVWRVAEQAEEAGVAGERLLAGLHLLGGAPRGAHPEALIAGLRAMRVLGGPATPRSIALAAAILDGR